MYHQIKKIQGKKYHYLIENLRLGKAKWKKFSIYLGKGDFSKKKIGQLIGKNREEAKKQIDSYLRKTDSLYALLTEKELAELERMQKGYNKTIENKKVDYNSFEEAFITEFTYDTNAIEGSSLSLQETSLLLYDNITPKGKDLREIYEAQNHKSAFEFIETYRGDVSKKFTLKVHKKLMHNILGKNAGKTRDVQVIIRGATFMPPPAKEVEKQLNELVKWYKENKKRYNPIIVASYFHVAFESIHPFRDGNGRTGRLIVNFILQKNKYPPINIRNRDRAQYISALENGRKGDLRPFINLLLKCVRENKIVELGAQK